MTHPDAPNSKEIDGLVVLLAAAGLELSLAGRCDLAVAVGRSINLLRAKAPSPGASDNRKDASHE